MANALQKAADPYGQDNPSLWRRLGNTALGGVAALGNVLDLPGSSARDLLALKNPLDQWLPWNWTTSEHRTSGRDLARQFGMASDENTYGNFFGGMGLEVATDPLTYLGAGALLRGAKAGASGTKGLLRASLPFSKTGTELFTGKGAEAVASGLGTAAEAVYKPSVLAPLLEKGAEYVPWMKGSKALDDAAKSAASVGGDNVRYVLPAQPARATMDDVIKSMSPEDLGKYHEHLDSWLRDADLSHPEYTKNEISHQLVKKELGNRRQGTLPLAQPATAAAKTGIQTAPIPKDQNPLYKAAAMAGQPQGQQWAQTVAEALTSPARTAMKLFHAPSMGHATEAGQQFGATLHPAQQKAAVTARNVMADFADSESEIAKSFSEVYGKDVLDQLKTKNPELAKNATNIDSYLKHATSAVSRMVGETGDVAASLAEHGLDPAKMTKELSQKMTGLAKNMKQAREQIYTAYQDMGGHGGTMVEIAPGMADDLGQELPGMAHVPRSANPEGTGGGFMGWLKGLTTRPTGSLAREEATRYVPQSVVEKIAHDDAVRGVFAKEQQLAFKKAGIPEEQWAAHHVNEKYGKWLNRETVEGVDAAGKPTTVPKWNPAGDTPLAHATALANWASKPHGFPVYQNDLLATESKYLSGMHVAAQNLQAIHKFVGDTLGAAEGGSWRPLTPKAAELPKGAQQLRGTMDFTQSLQGQPAVFIKDLYQNYGKMDAEKSLEYLARQTKIPVEKLKEMAVPIDVAKAIEGSRKVLDNPSWWESVAELSDVPTSWFKTNVTLPFASFATRNFVSGNYMNLSGGDINSLADLTTYGKLVKQHFDDWKAGKITPEREREWFTNGVLSGNTHFEGVQYRHPEFGKVIPDNPLQVKQSFAEAGEELQQSGLDRVPGLRTARQAHGAVLTTGAKANGLVEFLNRVPMYEYLKSKGMSAEQAAKRVLELQVDYSPANFSPFENEVMRRVAPFYSYQRKIAPVILRTLLRHPTGVMGQTIRASRLAGSDDPTTPPWIGDSLAIPSPFGSTEEGGRSYITGLGLPHESVAGYFGGGIRGAGRQALSQLNPLIKAPLEWVSGQSFFQTGPNGIGRPLDELNPPIGQTLANVARFAGRDPSKPVDLPDALEFAAANSPASRFISTARQITDPRKSIASTALNQLTGIRIADVSPAAADAALAGRVGSLLKDAGGRTFAEAYIPADRLAALPPHERELAQQLIALKKTIAQRGKQRKKNKLELAAAQ